MSFHVTIVILTILLMITMMIHTGTTSVLIKKKQKLFCIGYAVIALTATLDYFAIAMNYSKEYSIFLHYLVIATEHTIAPMIVIIMVMILNSVKKVQYMFPVFILNGLVEFASCFGGYIFYITPENVFMRGDYYIFYVFIYLLSIFVMFKEIYEFSKEYQHRNTCMLFANLLILLFGIYVNVLYPEIKTAFLSVAICAIIMYLYYLEQIVQTDSLTKLLNRRCYDRMLENLEYTTAIIVIDANNFKYINDTYGHKQGDIVLKKLSFCIRKVFGQYGFCYRIGGDEFCIILKRGILNSKCIILKNIILNLHKRIDDLCIKDEVMTNVSVGYAIYNGTEDLQSVLSRADAMMYKNKHY